MQKIPCVFCFDRAFIEKAAVAIASLCVHATSDLKIYCLVSGVDDSNLDVLRKIAGRFRSEIIFVRVDNQFAGWKTRAHITEASYFRLLIPANVPEPKVVYLDCDLLITCDLRELFDVDLGDALIAARPDRLGTISTKINLVGNDPYVNAGVLVLNLDRLRAEEFHLRTQQAYEAHQAGIVWADQCLINKMTEGRKRLIDVRWNVMAHDRGNQLLRQYQEPYDGKGILHFSGEVKPWHPWSGAWEAGLWASYARLAGVPASEPDRVPATVSEWKAVARQCEEDGRWQEAAAALKVLAKHFEKKAYPQPAPVKPA